MSSTIRLKKDLSSTRPKPISGKLILEDGTIFTGIKIGFKGSSVGEVCFNTSMTGYQEIITDPHMLAKLSTLLFLILAMLEQTMTTMSPTSLLQRVS